MIIIKIIVGLYAALSIIASFSEGQENGFKWINYIYFLCSGLLLIAIWLNMDMRFLLAGLIGLMIIAVITGVIAQDFHWSHHIVRFIVSAMILGAVIYFKTK